MKTLFSQCPWLKNLLKGRRRLSQTGVQDPPQSHQFPFSNAHGLLSPSHCSQGMAFLRPPEHPTPLPQPCVCSPNASLPSQTWPVSLSGSSEFYLSGAPFWITSAHTVHGLTLMWVSSHQLEPMSLRGWAWYLPESSLPSVPAQSAGVPVWSVSCTHSALDCMHQSGTVSGLWMRQTKAPPLIQLTVQGGRGLTYNKQGNRK